MAPTRRQHTTDLKVRLHKQPHRYSFFQAMRLLVLLHAQQPRRGTLLPRHLRFRTLPTLGFPASEIHSFRSIEGTDYQELEVTFMGLTGPSGTLPSAYTELVQERRVHFRDETLHRFLDIFSHRAIALLTEAWMSSRLPIQHELAQGQDSFTEHILNLTGRSSFSTVSGGSSGGLPPQVPAFFAGAFSRRTLPAVCLEEMAKHMTGERVEMAQFVGHWVSIPTQDMTRLGQSGASLGRNTHLGERVWDRQSEIGLKVGPLPLSRARSFFPGGTHHELLASLVREALGSAMTCRLSLLVEPSEIAPIRLDGTAPLLGRDAWLTTGEVAEIQVDMHFPVA